MPVDSSIYQNLQVPDIMGSIQKGLSMRDLAMQSQQRNQEMQRQQAIKDAYNQGMVTNPDGTTSLDSQKTVSYLAGKGYGQEANEMSNQMKAQAAAEMKARRDRQSQELGMTAQLLGGVSDQNSWSAALQKAKASGLDVSQMPQAYDPKFVNSLNYSVLTAQERMAQANKDAELALKKQSVGIDREKLGIEREKVAVDMQKAKAAGGANEGRKAVDKDYAKDYNDFTGGGEGKALRAIERLKQYRDQLANESKSFIQAGGGPISGSLPDALRTQSSIALRDGIISEANGGLKATFGSQLSDGERKAAASEYYNDKLDAAGNVTILDRKIAELENQVADQRAKAKYFESNGSLSGFRSNPSLQKIVDGVTYYKVEGGWLPQK